MYVDGRPVQGNLDSLKNKNHGNIDKLFTKEIEPVEQNFLQFHSGALKLVIFITVPSPHG